MRPDEALFRLREAGVPRAGWHLRRLQEAGGDLAVSVRRVVAGEPVHRVVGRREFHGLDLALAPATLEPRDDTEALVSLALERPFRRFADLGTGPGTVGLALASERPDARGVLTDLSAEALAVAWSNAERLGLAGRLDFHEGSWCAPLGGRFDLIASNPPYIATDVLATLDRAVRDHDPVLALDGGRDGLDAYRAILASAADHLTPDGVLALEIGYDQAAALSGLANEFGWRVDALRRDLGGRDRAVRLVPLQRPKDRGPGVRG